MKGNRWRPDPQKKAVYDVERRKTFQRTGFCGTCGKNLRGQFQNCDRCRTKTIERNKNRRILAKRLAFDHYGRSCVCCGESIERFLQFDHVNNDGAIRRKLNSGEKTAPALWLVKHNFPKDFQVLCANCNFAKKFGLCPHKESHLARP